MLAQAESRLDLSALSDEAFNQIVNQDVRGTLTSATSQLLRDPRVVERWYVHLVSLKRSVESQLCANRAELLQKQLDYVGLGAKGNPLWIEAQATAAKWRAGAVRFKNGVEDRLDEARTLRSKTRADSTITILIEERERAIRNLTNLRRSILEHREHDCDDRCVDDCVADDQLWKVLDNVEEIR